LISLAGIYSLLQIATLVKSNHGVEGWLSAGIGIFLLTWGLIALGNGLLKMFRFYVGRNVPASLAPNLVDSESRHLTAYKSGELHDMLMGRKNTTVTEPQSLFARLVHTLLPRLLFMPPLYRSLAENLLFGLSMTLFMLLAFSLTWFASITGLARLDDTPVLPWFGALLGLYLIKLWLGMRNPFRHYSRGAMNISLWHIGIILSLAILLPVALAHVHQNLLRIPDLPVEPLPYLITLLVLAALTCSLGMFLLIQRLRLAEPKTEVSEHRDNWQRNLMPRELFIHLDTHILANRRHQDIPNRVYQNFDPQLVEEGGREKGSFSGRSMVETQPILAEIPHSAGFRTVRVATSIIGQLLLAAGALWLVTLVDNLARASHRPEELLSLVYPLLLLIFGQVISRMSNAFWAEMQFRSLLVELSVEGTYTESRLSTGSGIHDSTRSENTVVRSTITPWFLLSSLLSSTFVRSGSMNLEQQRHILSLEKADQELGKVLDELDTFFKGRQTIAGINEVDLQSASQIFQMNEQTRARSPASHSAALEAEQAAGLLRQQEETEKPPMPA
jgi:hypothetical protein